MGLLASGFAAGTLLGVATALKLTNGVFAIGVLGFALAGRDTPRERFGWLILCGLTAMTGFVCLAGPWYLAVWERFGNPFFPFYNNIFHSPDIGWTAIQDLRYLPRSPLDLLRYPMYWLTGGSPTPGIGSPSSEVAFRDARWILAIPGYMIALGLLLVSRQWRRSRLTDPMTGLLFAFLIVYVVWLFEFGYHRYMLTLGILCGSILLLLAMLIRHYYAAIGLCSSAVLLSWCLVVVPDWGYVPWEPYWAAINPVPVNFGAPSIIFFTGAPMRFTVASLPTDAIYVNIEGNLDLRANSGTSLSKQLQHELDASANVLLKEIDRGVVPAVAGSTLAGYGLVITDRCQPLLIAVDTFRICEVIRRP